MKKKKYISVYDYAEKYNTSHTTIYERIRSGQIIAERIGKVFVIDEEQYPFTGLLKAGRKPVREKIG